MKIITPFTCICKTVSRVKLKEPTLLRPIVVPFTCGACQSKFILRYRKLKKNEEQKEGQVMLYTKTLEVGEKAETIAKTNEARKPDA